MKCIFSNIILIDFKVKFLIYIHVENDKNWFISSFYSNSNTSEIQIIGKYIWILIDFIYFLMTIEIIYIKYDWVIHSNQLCFLLIIYAIDRRITQKLFYINELTLFPFYGRKNNLNSLYICTQKNNILICNFQSKCSCMRV